MFLTFDDQMKLVMRDWDTGKILNQYNLDNYEQEWGNVYNMFHRQDMHATLLKTAIAEEGEGTPCAVNIDHMYVSTSAGLVDDRSTNLDPLLAASLSMRRQGPLLSRMALQSKLTLSLVPTVFE